MNRLIYVFVFSFLIIGKTAWTQHLHGHWCGTDQYYHHLLEKDPHLKKDMDKFLQNIAMQAKDDDYDSTTVYIIPIVFHIVHQYGVENISDAQIFDQVAILNRDFRKRNADTVDIIPVFQDIAADAKIEFRLASVDPQGNCTNGIDRIYSHEHRSGGELEFAKPNQWDRSRYLNVWIVSKMDNGVAGYATFPSMVTGVGGYWMDGVVLLHTSTGSIGTGSLYNSRSLTHEIGHYLSLFHPWGNERGGAGFVSCDGDDDGVEDTPLTKGYPPGDCPSNPELSKRCNPNIYENYQNYMDYSYCENMFTAQQVKRMRTVLVNSTSLRDHLHTEENLAFTGASNTVVPTCAPIVAINSNTRYTCVGESVSFQDKSYNGTVTTYLWEFEDGTPATSTDANPTVSFDSPGKKTIRLTVGNSAGTTTKEFTKYVDVQPSTPTIIEHKTFDFETSDQYAQLSYFNDGDTYSEFIPASVGHGSNHSLKLTNQREFVNPTPGSPETRYYLGLKRQVDAIITPTFDLSNLSNAFFSFSYSYAISSTLVTPDKMNEQIRIYISKDCGKTWNSFGSETQSTISGVNLLTSGITSSPDYTPTTNQQWNIYSRLFNISASDNNVRFKIEFTADSHSANLYIDNISVSEGEPIVPADTPLGLHDLNLDQHFKVSPNPIVSGNDLQVQYLAFNEPVTFTLRNLQGEIVASVERNDKNQMVSFGFPIENKIAASYYLLEARSASSIAVRKIAVMQ